jgi:CheY-like chemotaxis protein
MKESVQTAPDASSGKLVVVIDDDPLVLDAIGGLLRRWRYRVVAADSDRAALARLAEDRQSPDLIICDYHLSDGSTGIEAIKRVCNAVQIPAILITGDALCGRQNEVRALGCHVLLKPVNPRALRAVLKHALKYGGARRQRTQDRRGTTGG